jgi:hypothetical protein
MMRETQILSDVAQRVIAGPVGEAWAKGSWRRAPYETAEVKGTLLGCTSRTEPAPVTIRLGAGGPWRVWLGIPVFNEPNRIRVRLTGDRCYRPFATPQADYHHPVVHEVFFKDADLTGQDLVLDGFWGPDPVQGALAWVRLEPLEALPKAAPPKVAHPLAFTEDAHGLMYLRPHRRSEDLYEEYEAFPEGTALKIMLWVGIHGDLCTYPTRVGQYGLVSPCNDYTGNGDALVQRNFDLWRSSGWDALQTARDYCRSRGWEFHAAIRIQTFARCYPDDETGSRFFFEHPECWCRDAQGRAVTRLSYAHPAVRTRFLALMDELIAYAPDGINLQLNRGLPLVLYEPAMVEGFQARHGLDPRTLAEDDARWLDYQAEVITDLVRQLKARLRPGMRLSAIVPCKPADLRRWGLDVRTWVGEGLMDDLYPIGQDFTDHDVHRDAPGELDYSWFDSLPGREKIRLIPAVYPWRMFHQDREKWKGIVRGFLSAGADGYCVWDGREHEWREYIDIGLSEAPARPCPAARTYPLTMLGGFRVDRYHPIEPF